MSKEAMKLALDALKADQKLIEAYRPKSHTDRLLNAIKALEEALAKQEQGEPVGEVILYTGDGFPCAPFHQVKWSDGMMPPVGTKFYTTPQQRKPLTDKMIFVAARVMNDRQADACNVDRDDQWKIYGQDFIGDARAMLEAAHGIKE